MGCKVDLSAKGIINQATFGVNVNLSGIKEVFDAIKPKFDENIRFSF